MYTQYTILSPHTITITNFLPKYYANLNLCNFFGSSDTAGWVTRWVQIYMKQFSTHFIFIFHTSKKQTFCQNIMRKLDPCIIYLFSVSLWTHYMKICYFHTTWQTNIDKYIYLNILISTCWNSNSFLSLPAKFHCQATDDSYKYWDSYYHDAISAGVANL